MTELIATGSGQSISLGRPYLAATFSSDPAKKVVDFFSEYLAPHPEGFSGYFEPSTDGWHESRADHCGVHIVRLNDGQHLLLVAWQTDDPADVTQRQIRQMSDAWRRVFAGVEPVPLGQLVEQIGRGEIVSPQQLGLSAENAGAVRKTTTSNSGSGKRRGLFRRR